MSLIAGRLKRISIYPAAAAALLVMGISASTASPTASNQESAYASVQPRAMSARLHWYQFGRASWYGGEFQGQPTASGEAYNMYRMTCAHRNLPLGALIRVTNLRNHRSVVVQVNDRGPVPENRVIDLSYAAARVLGFRGVARVRLDLIDLAPSRNEVAQLAWPGKR